MRDSGGWLNVSATICWINGIRVEPPTNTTSSSWDVSSPASRSTCAHTANVRSVTGWMIWRRLLWVNTILKVWPLIESSAVTWSAFDNCSLSVRACTFSSCFWWLSMVDGYRPVCWMSQLAIKRSISSPPSALLPPVASTSYTPWLSFNTDTSNVPPPKS